MAGLIQRHAYLMVGGVILFESMGIPLPGESLLIAAALYAAATGDIAIEWVVLAAALGAVIGDNAGYLIGRRVGPPLLERYGPRIGLTLGRQRLGQFLYLRHGGKVVFFGRFVGFLRTFAGVLAGANQMPWKRFLAWNAAGGIVWTSIYGFGSFLLGSQARRLVGPFGLVVGVAALVAVVYAVIFVRRHETRLIGEAQVALAAHEAASAGEPGPEGQVTPARTDW